MFERYTDDARKVIFFARYEASRLGASSLEAEHLWLGLLRQNKRLIKRLAPHVTVDAIHTRILRRGGPPLKADRISMTTDLPLAEPANRVLTQAAAQADEHKQRYITSEAIVNALLLEEAPAS